VSVIIPVWNREAHLAAAIRSARDQDYRPIEIIVVDDGSTDRSAEVARSFAEVTYCHQPNRGAASARNTGIRRSRGALIAFLDSDDFWLPGKLTAQVEYLVEHPAVGYVVCRMKNVLDPGMSRPPWLNPADLAADPVSQTLPAMLVRRIVLEEVGPFDERYAIGEDTDWLLRARDRGVETASLDGVFLHRRIHAANLSHRAGSMRAATMLRILRSSVGRKRT
jgi:glycosyltransferase involved in cell wall biosynthesis